MSVLDISVDLDTETIIWPDPCAGGKSCRSNQELPAVWLWTHLGANPRCAQVFCEACDAVMREFIDAIVIFNGGLFNCSACGMKAFPRKDLVRRHI